MQTAFKWGVTPHEFDNLPMETQAEMVAFANISTIIENYEIEQVGNNNKSNFVRQVD